MKSVVQKSSVVLSFILLFSCHKSIIDSKKNESITIKEQVTGSDLIITNSLDPGFDEDLIKTKKVAKGDTILFREWANAVSKPVVIYDNKIKYILSKDTVSKFYKTGEEMFSKNEITILNTLTKKDFKINAIAILDKDARDIYANNQPSSYLKIKKMSKTKGTFDFSSERYKEYYIDFKIKNNAVHIIKLSNLEYSYSENYKYELDTLIVLHSNDLIYPDSLRSIVCKERNRILPIKDNKTVAEYLTLGSEKEDLKDYRGAIADYDRAIGLEPQNATVYHNRGLAKYSLKDYRGAIADFGKSIALEPNTSASSYFNRGLAKYGLQNYSGAIADYNKSIALDPHPATYFNRGDARIKLGQKSEACLDFRKSAELGIYWANDSIKKYCN
jgi:tetratricopeptide (TPR) repeat protein